MGIGMSEHGRGAHVENSPVDHYAGDHVMSVVSKIRSATGRPAPTPGPFFWAASAGGFVIFLQEGRRNASIYAKSGVTRGASV